VILVALAILASTLVGVGAERRHGQAAVVFANRMIGVLIWGLQPFITVFIVARLHLGSGVGVGLLLGFAELACVGTLAYIISTRVLKLSRPSTGALILAVIVANTGYLGIPLNAALLGHGALAPAIAWDTIISQIMLYVPGYAVGAAFGTRAGASPAERAKAFLTRNPVIWALILGLAVPDALAPDAVVSVARFCAAYAVLPLGFFMLGVNMMAEREEGSFGFPPPLTPAVGVSLGLRLAVAPALLALLSLLTVDVPDAYFLQAAMASGINSLIVGHLYGLDLRLAAATITWSTTLVVVLALVLSPII
jgi:malate permease and related proteins